MGIGMKKLRVKLTASLLLVLAGSLGLTGIVDAQTVYRSVDDKGNVSYTDRPPLLQEKDSQPVDVMELQIQLTNPVVIAANRDAAAKEAKANKVAAEIRSEHEGKEAEEKAREEASRVANCAKAKSRLKSYRENSRIYREQENGDREYLSSEELDAERASAARSVDELCD